MKSWLIGFILVVTTFTPAFSQVQDLAATQDDNGNVVLTWDLPTGQVPIKYVIYRTNSLPLFEKLATLYTATAKSYTDYYVLPGTYYYAVDAVYSDTSAAAFVSISVVEKTASIAFTSRPLITAIVNKTYDYPFTVSAPDIDNLKYSFEGSHPDSMVINQYDRRVYWVPRKIGYYPVTLVATDTVNNVSAYQRFAIRVANKPVIIKGTVKSEIGTPLANAEVRLSQTGNGTTFTYTAYTDSSGNFRVENAQAGKYYAYAKSPVFMFSSQWYKNASSLIDARENNIVQGDSLELSFILTRNFDAKTTVSGSVVDSNGTAIRNAAVSFIRQRDFLRIGDTTNRSNPYLFSLNEDLQVKADTVVLTDSNGTFSARLPLGTKYYILCQHKDFEDRYYDQSANPLEARAIVIDTTSGPITFALPYTNSSDNRITGKVTQQENGKGIPADIVLIQKSVSRGAGGTTTFRFSKSDSSGVFLFSDLPDSALYILLAAPRGAHAPMYYRSSGATRTWSKADSFYTIGTLQNLDVQVPAFATEGLGSIWGRVLTFSGNRYIPVTGVLIYAVHSTKGTIEGYAISDSAGWYSIPSLNPNTYTVYADKPGYVSTSNPNIVLSYSGSSDPTRIQEVNFYLVPTPRISSTGKDIIPGTLTLHQNFPNPFNPTTVISFTLPRREFVTLSVYSAYGQVVKTLVSKEQPAGTYEIEFDASNLPSGVYIYQLKTKNRILTKRMILAK